MEWNKTSRQLGQLRNREKTTSGTLNHNSPENKGVEVKKAASGHSRRSMALSRNTHTFTAYLQVLEGFKMLP